jgi:hypothetical protein
LQRFVNRLDLDISKEAELLQSKIGRAQSLIPHIDGNGEKAKLHVKGNGGPDGKD